MTSWREPWKAGINYWCGEAEVVGNYLENMPVSRFPEEVS